MTSTLPLVAGCLQRLRKVHREPLEISEFAVSQCTLMRGAQDDPRRIFRFKCFLQTRRTQAPPVTRFQARKAELRHWGGKIIPV